MTKSEAITAIYAVFNAPHNADINIVYLNKVLDDLCKSHPEQEEWPEEPVGHMAGRVRPPQRTWVGLSDAEIKKIVGADRYTDLLLEVVKVVEAKLKEKNSA